MKVLRTAAIVVATVASIALIATGVGAPIGPGLLGITWGTIAAGASLIAAATTLATGPPSASVEGFPDQFKLDPTAPVPIVFGRSIAGGYGVHRAAWGPELNDVENPYQGFVTIFSLGPIEAIESFLVDRVAVSFDGTGATTSADYMRDGTPFMWLKTQLGACPESAALALPSPVNVMPGWGSTYKLSGLAAGMWALRFDKKSKIYTAGVPRPQAVIKGVKGYDPRFDSTYPGGSGPQRANDPSTWTWTQNPWILALTFALGFIQNGHRVAGVGMAATAIDMAAFVEAANIADANGWTAGGTVNSNDDKWTVLKQLAQAGGGEPIRLGAKLSCMVDAPRVSLATITSADPIGRLSIPATQPFRDRINGIVPRIRSEEHGWEIVPLDVVQPATYVAEDGDTRTRERDYPLVQDKNQAAELAAYDVCDSREFGPITVQLKTVWMGYKPGDCITLDIPDGDLNGQTAIITNRELDPGSGTVTLTLKSETTAKHDFALGRTGVAPPTPGLTPPNINDVAAPAAGDWEATGGVIENASGDTVPAIIVFGGATVSTIDAILFEYRKTGDTVWAAAGTEAPTATRKEIVGLPPTQAYDVAVSYIVRGVQGARLILGPVTTGQWSIIGDLDARLSNPTVQLEADFAGVVSDYSPATGQWIVKAGGVDVTADFAYTIASGGNPGTLDVTLVGAAYSVTGGFDPEDDVVDLTLHAAGTGGFSAVTFDRVFRLSKIRAPYAVDTVPPGTPSGLTLSSVLRTDSDGTQRIYLIATWSANTDSDLSRYRLLLRQAGDTNFVTYEVGGTRYEVPALGGTTYEARLQAIDNAGNISNTYPTPPAVVSYTTIADSSVPSAPTGLTATAGVHLIHLTWTNDAATDLDHVDLYENTTNSSGTATKIASVPAVGGEPGYTARGDLATNTTRYYWMKSVDTSGNTSGFSTGASATTLAVGNDDIFAGSLYANRLFVSGVAGQDALPTGITIGVGGTTIGTVDTRSSDPIARANSKTTRLSPGLVQISGTTNLDDWRFGGDNTRIDGGAIGADSILVNFAKIGMRGLDIAGLEFQANWNVSAASTNWISWTAGTISYIGDGGTPTTASITAGSTSWASGTLYIYWTKAGTNLQATTSQATAYGANNVVLATYRGGTDMVVTYGRTIIDGSKITTRTVDADVLIAGTISSFELATTVLISASSQLGDAVVTTLKIGGAALTVPSVTTFSDVTLADTGAEQTIGTTSNFTVGDAVDGSALVTISGHFDGTVDIDAAAQLYLDISTDNGGSWTQVKTFRCGSRSTTSSTYSYFPWSAQYQVSGITQVKSRVRAKAIPMGPGASTRSCAILETTIVTTGSKR